MLRLFLGTRTFILKMNILLVDTNFSSMPIYEELVSSGHNVFVIGRNRNDYLAVGLKKYIHADYSNKEILATVVKKYEIDYIIPGCNDASYAACSGLIKTDNVSSIDDPSVTQTILNKEIFRDFSKAHNLSAPLKYDLAQIHKNPPKHSILVKPTDSFSGKGITRLDSLDSAKLASAIHLAEENSKSKKFLIEDYIEGQLYSHSAFISEKKIARDFWVTEYSFVNKYAVDTSHIAYELSDTIKEKIRNQIIRLASILNIKNGLIHTQFIVDHDLNVWLIEITRRCPGDLYSKLIQHSTGFNYSAAYTNYFINKRTDISQKIVNDKKIVLRHTITDNHTGIFKSIEFSKNTHFLEYIQIASIGAAIKPSPAGRIGILFLQCHDHDELQEVLRQISNKQLYKINYMTEQ